MEFCHKREVKQCRPRASKNSSSELSTESLRMPCPGHCELNLRKAAERERERGC